MKLQISLEDNEVLKKSRLKSSCKEVLHVNWNGYRRRLLQKNSSVAVRVATTVQLASDSVCRCLHPALPLSVLDDRS